MGYQICLLLKICLFNYLLWDSKVQAAAPVFSTPDASTPPESVPENESQGRSIITIDATDADGDGLTYSIFSQTPNSPPFELESGSGTLKTPSNLNAEVSLVYTFVFSVTDGTTTVDSAPFNVTITDINEFSPVFSPASYTRTILDSVASGTTVTTVAATDGDATATVSYSIVSGNTGSVFAVDSNSGVITTASAITAGPYTLTVRASDGTNTVVGTVTVTVNVDFCQPNPCLNSGTCANSGSSYTCTCTSGFTGTNCSDAPKPEDCNITCIILIVVGILIAVVSGVVVYLHKTKRIDLNKCRCLETCNSTAKSRSSLSSMEKEVTIPALLKEDKEEFIEERIISRNAPGGETESTFMNEKTLKHEVNEDHNTPDGVDQNNPETGENTEPDTDVKPVSEKANITGKSVNETEVKVVTGNEAKPQTRIVSPTGNNQNTESQRL